MATYTDSKGVKYSATSYGGQQGTWNNFGEFVPAPAGSSSAPKTGSSPANTGSVGGVTGGSSVPAPKKTSSVTFDGNGYSGTDKEGTSWDSPMYASNSQQASMNNSYLQLQQQMKQQQQYWQQLEAERRQAEETARQRAAAETARLTQDRTRMAGQTKQSMTTTFDRAKQQQGDQRNVQDNKFARLNNPYSGGTDYLRTQLAREREITDRQQQEDLSTRLSGVDTALADYVNAVPEMRSAIEADLIARERNYSLQAGNQYLNANQQGFNQMMDQFRTLAPYQYLTASERNFLPLQYAQTFMEMPVSAPGGVPAPMSQGNVELQSIVTEIERRKALGQDISDLVQQLKKYV